MVDESRHALSEVLDRLERFERGETTSVAEVVERLGQRSFATLMLGFAMISLSPASAIPGVTAMVAAIVFILAIQMIAGRRTIWLPRMVTRRRISSAKLERGIEWLRRPAHFVERYMKARFTFLLDPPWIWLPLVLILGLTLFMPVMEIVPTSGSIASGVIMLFAAGLLTRDGAFVLVSLILLSALPLAVWWFGFEV